VPIEFNDLNRAPPVILNVFDTDEDLLDSTDDFIGRATIFLNKVDVLSNDDTIPYPRWYPVKKDITEPYDEKTGAKVLCSFSITESDFVFKVPSENLELNNPFEYAPGVLYPMPNLMKRTFKCDIMVLGLRNLLSSGLLPIRKAYVKFGVKSLLPPEQSKAIDDIQTLPSDGGPNPNINTTLQFEVVIPSDPTFCPMMTCDVYD